MYEQNPITPGKGGWVWGEAEGTGRAEAGRDWGDRGGSGVQRRERGELRPCRYQAGEESGTRAKIRRQQTGRAKATALAGEKAEEPRSPA